MAFQVVQRLADAVLDRPVMYRALHSATGLRKLHAHLLQRVLTCFSVAPNLTVLDLGCGPGDTADLLPAGVRYIGVDVNPRYVDVARRCARSGSEFFVGDVTRLDPRRFTNVDLIVAFGLVHHLSDADADALLANAARMLKPTGRLITLDGCRRGCESAVVRWILDHDRGRYVRAESSYLAMLGRHFHVEDTLRDASPMNIPYSILSVIARPLEVRT
jgi:SAM-dependent methyltransferase